MFCAMIDFFAVTIRISLLNLSAKGKALEQEQKYARVWKAQWFVAHKPLILRIDFGNEKIEQFTFISGPMDNYQVIKW